MKRPLAIVFLLSSLVGLAGCRPFTEPPVLQNVEALYGPTWQLTGFTATNGTTVPLSENTGYTVAFRRDSTLTGRADCNIFQGSFLVSPDGEIAIGGLNATDNACSPESVAQRFLAALSRAARYEIDPQRLHVFYSGNGSLTFEKR
jgi:heat shock protein HslJ